MQQQILPPRVQDGNDANLSAQAFGVCRHFQQGGGSSGKQQIVEAVRVLEREHVQFMWSAEDDMEVCRRQASRSRAASQRWRACVWHLGQCRLRQEL